MTTKTKYALITGATKGIGLELAKLFAKDGYFLVIVARDPDELAHTAAELERTYEINVITLQRDLFDPENAFDVYNQIKNKGIKIDVLVNNAGHGNFGHFAKTDIHRELEIINLNVSSLVILTKLYLQDMIKSGEGKILNLSSVASKTPGPWQAVYHATKAFVQSFTEAVREEVKNTGITITALLPGATATDFFRKANMLTSKIMDNEMADPADVAKDGYDALMAGKDMVISGFQNKVEVLLDNITSDKRNAEKMVKHQEPINNN